MLLHEAIKLKTFFDNEGGINLYDDKQVERLIKYMEDDEHERKATKETENNSRYDNK